ncbi:Tify domain [Dillenia turbinata]|uniref:Protein TIFY n=1 Tax=Dillenia turbinata TaxID=194707 RepID=A0AAN8V1G9_9MAGN
MERDFLGLNSKDPVGLVKEETTEPCNKDSVYSKGPGLSWPFSNKVSVLHPFLSFKVSQDDRTKKLLPDPLAHSAFMPIATADALDTSHKRPMGEIQKSFSHERQGGNHFSVTAYPVHNVDSHSVHHTHDTKMFPVSNQMISVSMNGPFSRPPFGNSGQNLPIPAIKQQLIGGVCATSSSSVLPPVGTIAGVTETWNNLKPSVASDQLTIFYAGAVNVYDDITPEKAQAIMFVAGQGASIASTRVKVPEPTLKLLTGDGVHMTQPISTSPCSALSSPISVASHPIPQSRSGASSNEESVPTKSIGVSAAPVSKDTQKVSSSLGPVTASMVPSAVPQARKASLARFLEKRKERVMSAAPYNLNGKPSDCLAAVSNCASLSISSAAGPGSLSAAKETTQLSETRSVQENWKNIYYVG